jgi:hypothetical protein
MATAEPVKKKGKAPAAPPPPPPARRDARWLVPLGVLTVIFSFVTALAYRSYAEEHLRKAKAPGCAIDARVYLRQQALVSGTEPHDLPSGETVYLTEPEDHAVRCAKGISLELGARVTAAFTEQQPELRALELLKVLRDHVPSDKAHDRHAATAYYIVRAAMQTIPDLPEKKAALDELELLHACRFDTKMKCPTRPGLSPWVWVSGAVAAMGLLTLGKIGGSSLITRIRAALRRRAARKAPPARPAR